MERKGFSLNLIYAFREMFSKATMQIGENEPVLTNVGVIQGGINSPQLFALFLNELLELLN